MSNRDYFVGFFVGLAICAVLVFLSGNSQTPNSQIALVTPSTGQSAALAREPCPTCKTCPVCLRSSSKSKSSSSSSSASCPTSAPCSSLTSTALSVFSDKNPPTIETASKQPVRTMIASGDEFISAKRPPLQCIPPPSPLKAEIREGHSIWDAKDIDLTPVRETPHVIYDCFMFNGEFELLEIRLEELWPVVDYFVLVEASTTQVGQPKPLHFNENKHKFTRYMSKIIHIMTDNGDQGSQRNSLMGYLRQLPADTVILQSDLDEIPRCWTMYNIRYMKELPRDMYGLIKMDFFYYSYRWRKSNTDRFFQIHQQTTAKVVYRSYLDSHDLGWMAFAHHKPDRHWFIDHSGWHCSYCFAPERIRKKIQGLAHQENNREPFINLDFILERTRTGKDLFQRDGEDMDLQKSCDPDVPFLIKTQRERFKMFYPDLDKDGQTTTNPFK